MKLKMTTKIVSAAVAVALCQLAQAGSADVPGVGEQPDTYFYTGKPYDADLNAYTFPYRSYDPHVNRWTSADPSGFPNGANQWAYCFAPNRQCDPLGLNYTEYYGSVTVSVTVDNFWGEAVDASASLLGDLGGEGGTMVSKLIELARSHLPPATGVQVLDCEAFDEWDPEEPTTKTLLWAGDWTDSKTAWAYGSNASDAWCLPDPNADLTEQEWNNVYPLVPFPGTRSSVPFQITLSLDGHWGVYE